MISLPAKFEKDIQGTTNYLQHLVVINYSWAISTSSFQMAGINYQPLIKSLGTIKQSVDIEKNNFKTSSVSIKLYNREYNNVRIINKLFEQEVINKPLKIYAKSQTAESLDDCLLIYSGYIKEIKENKDDITLVVEDKTEQTFSKLIPDHFTNREFLPEEHQDVLIPIVYGDVERCPIVFDSKVADVSAGSMEARADYHSIKVIWNINIFENDIYARIRAFATQFDSNKDDTIYKNLIPQQYEIDQVNKVVLFDRELKQQSGFSVEGVEVDGYAGSPPAFNLIEVEAESFVDFLGGTYKLNYRSDSLGYEYAYSKSAIKSFDSFDMNLSEGWFNEGEPKVKVDDEGVKLFPTTFGTDADPHPNELIYDWYFGGHNNIYLNWDILFGENIFSFGGGKFISSSNLLTKIPKKNDEEKDFNYYIKLKLGYGEVWCLTRAANLDLPRLHVQLANDSHLFWSVKADALEQYPNFEAGDDMVVTTDPITIDFSGVKDINSSNNFTLGERYWDGNTDTFKLDYASGGKCGYWDFRNMRWHRRAVVTEFQSRKLFAHVEGRVDNINLRYTTTQDLYSTAQMTSLADNTRDDADIGTYQSTNAQTRQTPAKVKRKPIKRQKSTIKGKPAANKKKKKIIKGKGY